MKKILLLTMLLGCSTLFARWHSWEKLPNKGQLYMTVDMEPCEKPENRQILIVTHFNENNPICQYREEAWWDVRPYDLLKWFNQGSKVLYCPSGIDDNFPRRAEALLKGKK